MGLVSVLKSIKLAVEALSRRDANLLTSEGVLKFLFETIEKEDSLIATEMLTALKYRISQRRQNYVISVMKFLQNPLSIKQKCCEYYKMESKQKILKTIKQYMQFFVLRSGSSLIANSDSESDVELLCNDEAALTAEPQLSDILQSSTESSLKLM